MADKAAFTLELGVMRGRIVELDAKLHAGISAAVDEVGIFATTYAKTTAPWHDNTGAARAGLHSNTSSGGDRWDIVLAHAVSYGIWLEVANNGRYQVILPTLRVAMERMGSHLQGMMGDLR